jgi:signal transduction histidine kinase
MAALATKRVGKDHRMIKWFKISGGVILALWVGPLLAEEYSAVVVTNSLEIQSVVVDSNTVPWSYGASATLGPFPQNISFGFGPATNCSQSPIRLRYKLEGYDNSWRGNDGVMTLTVRFYDAAGDQISQKVFEVKGDSAGWKGENSPLTHRRENVVSPPKASRLLIVISSAGPPAAVGIYVVDDLVVTHHSSSGVPEVLLRSPLNRQPTDETPNRLPDGWIRDGTHPSMAKIIEIGGNPATKAFAVLDDDPTGHAEWHNIIERAPGVAPGDHLVIEWNEMFSLGMGNIRVAHYDSLPTGKFRFRVAEVSPMGIPTEAEASLAVIVPPPFWKEPWFWTMTCLAVAILLAALARYVIRHRMRAEMLRLENQRALEQERLRIAHDIHDDLGARVTQISLLSAMAHDNPSFPEKARTSFDQISRMSRDLVSALYETVWAVNPENDNLDALGNYLCQMVNQLCEQGQLRCRLHVLELPREIQISSQTRHNISMAVKEAVHNVIKHARASEVTVRIAWSAMLLTLSVQDDGCGFESGDHPAGNGLANMKRRLENIGGNCRIDSRPGLGTTVHLSLSLKPRRSAASSHDRPQQSKATGNGA